MNKTAIILSPEEITALPQAERPLNFRLTSKIYHDIFETVGAASMCWQPPPSTEVFDTAKAEQCAVDLCFKIAAELERLGVDPKSINENAPPTATVERKGTMGKSETNERKSGAAVLVQRMVSRRPDAKMDEDGHCTVCGCEVREYEGGTDDEAMRAHVCPPAFRMTRRHRFGMVGGSKALMLHDIAMEGDDDANP